MRDRLPTPGKENRVRITQDNGQVVEGTLAYADGATQEGSPYTKGNVLPDDVCNLLRIDPVTSEPKDAWVGVITTLGYNPLKIKLRSVAGAPIRGIRINGLTGVLPEKSVTDKNGEVFVLVNEGDYTLSVSDLVCLDAYFPSTPIKVRAEGRVQEVTIRQRANGSKATEFSSSTAFMFSDNVASVDVWALGGGGGGGAGGFTRDRDYIIYSGGGGGGGGGYTAKRTGLSPTPFVSYSVTVGSGGGGGGAQTNSNSNSSSTGADGGSGGSSSCSLGYVSARGGLGGLGGGHYESHEDGLGAGGSGGSGGGAGAQPPYYGSTSSSASTPGAGGSNGNNGQGSASSDYSAPGGSGQGSTTTPPGGPVGAPYGAGGGGGASYDFQDNRPGGAAGSSYAGAGGRSDGSSGTYPGGDALGGYGGGGGGGPGGIGGGSNEALPKDGGRGGSGRVILRWVTKT